MIIFFSKLQNLKRAFQNHANIFSFGTINQKALEIVWVSCGSGVGKGEGNPAPTYL